MATVYLARVLVVDSIHRPVAIKLMHPELRTLPRAVEELIEEARLVGSIQHPNVAKVLDAGDRGGYVYLVFDYVEGDTLAGLLATLRKQSRTLPLPIAALAAASYVAPALVAPFFRRLMLHPRRHVSAPPVLTLRAADQRLDLGDGLVAWRWGEGPTVLLAHGFEGGAVASGK